MKKYRLEIYSDDLLALDCLDSRIKNNCLLLDSNYEGINDFCYAGHWYTFATFVFKKN